MKTVDLITEEWETIIDIDKHPDYSLTDGFDIIKIIDDGDYENQANGRPMFGSSTRYEYVDCGSCTCVYEVQTLYVFWIKFESSQLVNLTNCG